MMDEMKITTPFTRKLVATMVKRAIRKKLGYDIDVNLNNIYVSVDENNVAHVHVDAGLTINKSDLERIVDEL